MVISVFFNKQETFIDDFITGFFESTYSSFHCFTSCSSFPVTLKNTVLTEIAGIMDINLGYKLYYFGALSIS